MPFALVFIGLLLIVTGAKNTYREFGAELVSDFTGEGNFTWWIASVGAVGALGYVPQFRDFSRWFMALIILSMLISNRGFFAQLTSALQSGPTTPKSEPSAQAPNDAQGITLPAVGSLSTGTTNAQAQDNFAKVMQVVKMFFIPG